MIQQSLSRTCGRDRAAVVLGIGAGARGQVLSPRFKPAASTLVANFFFVEQNSYEVQVACGVQCQDRQGADNIVGGDGAGGEGVHGLCGQAAGGGVILCACKI